MTARSLAGVRTKYRYRFHNRKPGEDFPTFDMEGRTIPFGSVAHFPSRDATFSVPPAPMRGRMAPVPLGDDEDQLCGRVYGNETCLGRLTYEPDQALGSCGCAHMRMPPCSYCTSTMPECPACGWREEE